MKASETLPRCTAARARSRPWRRRPTLGPPRTRCRRVRPARGPRCRPAGRGGERESVCVQFVLCGLSSCSEGLLGRAVRPCRCSSPEVAPAPHPARRWAARHQLPALWCVLDKRSTATSGSVRLARLRAGLEVKAHRGDIAVELAELVGLGVAHLTRDQGCNGGPGRSGRALRIFPACPLSRSWGA